MESSKSDENKEKEPQDTKVLVDNQTVVTIIDTNVEREIQNVLITSEYEENQPCCSWKDTGQHTTKTEEKKTEVGPAKASSTSSISISIDVNCPPFKENLIKVQENINHSNKSQSREENPHGTDIGRSSSLTNLFDDVEVIDPKTKTLPKSPLTNPPNFDSLLVTNQPRAQSPVVTGQPRAQSPVVTGQPRAQSPVVTGQPRAQSPPPTNQPRAQSPVHSRNSESPPSANRGIHVVNIPNDSINRSLQRADTLVNVPNNFNNRALQRADQVLGPPPSYSKSLLDRRVTTCASIQFVAPIPPPSYDGMENELRYAQTLGHTGGFTLGLGNTWQGQPQPAYCPVCETVIITQVDVRVSRIAHIVAMVMFLLFKCWNLAENAVTTWNAGTT